MKLYGAARLPTSTKREDNQDIKATGASLQTMTSWLSRMIIMVVEVRIIIITEKAIRKLEVSSIALWSVAGRYKRQHIRKTLT